jgi:hypothetical protein
VGRRIGGVGLFEEGPIRRWLRTRRERISGSAKVDVEKVVTLLTQVSTNVEAAKAATRRGEFDVAHRQIADAHTKLREASRLLGYRPRGIIA